MKVRSIVASLTLENQSSDISQTLFTALANGTFQLSLYVDMNGNGSGQGSGIVRIMWNDGSNAETFIVPNLGASVNVVKATCLPIHLSAGQALGINTSMDATINYNLYAIVEQLD